jgi:hypothetical protein
MTVKPETLNQHLLFLKIEAILQHQGITVHAEEKTTKGMMRHYFAVFTNGILDGTFTIPLDHTTFRLLIFCYRLTNEKKTADDTYNITTFSK